MLQQLNEKDNNNKDHDDEMASDFKVLSADTLSGKIIMQPQQAYLMQHNKKQLSSDNTLKKPPSITTTRQLSMSNLSLDMQTRITTKETSYSFIWIDDHYKSVSNLDQFGQEKSLLKKESFSTRGFCNVFTICFIMAIILFLFLYPFITMFLNK
ncbi:uncharacterized protein B0P05DRAFT_531363 [Gilbertella persicaria]|uniref:uncharacterized protein n=1 Tax=Gilbertella persicaria TaxID=101096 RepID=UPI00221E71BC|nr:uncharacterized protein B0P05DRAFT_531363 [Gilbertella persicaria]KAI8088073.1 hypothetical protein B0P05DRAFT_531363 [Gilbertella persicaria]